MSTLKFEGRFVTETKREDDEALVELIEFTYTVDNDRSATVFYEFVYPARRPDGIVQTMGVRIDGEQNPDSMSLLIAEVTALHHQLGHRPTR